jgi:sulfur carrier protein ThiS
MATIEFAASLRLRDRTRLDQTLTDGDRVLVVQALTGG